MIHIVELLQTDLILLLEPHLLVYFLDARVVYGCVFGAQQEKYWCFDARVRVIVKVAVFVYFLANF